MAENFYIALLQYPVYNKNGDVVTTAVANMDVHDISRAARTYGVERFYIVTPIAPQRELVEKILRHWQEGYGSSYNPSRREAFQVACVKSSLEEAIQDIASAKGVNPRLVATGASLSGELLTFKALKVKIRESSDPYLLLFGTGSGIAEEVLRKADYFLEPIKGAADYNHLSVRSAVSVVLDRLRGREMDAD
jgi:hypothetical protein